MIKIFHGILKDSPNNFAQLIKSQQKFFDIYQKRKFRELTFQQDFPYLINNMQFFKSNTQLKNQALHKFNIYSQLYAQLLRRYQNSNGSFTVKEQIIKDTKQIAQHLKRHYFNDQNLKKNTKQYLLAHIFAIWAIVKCIPDQDGRIQFLYQPHPAQIMALFLLLNIIYSKQFYQKSLINCMVQIPTGQGKSIVLAVLSVFLATSGFQVFCACYSDYLSKRDFIQFSVLFQAFDLINLIKYKTFSQVCQLSLDGKESFQKQVLKLLQPQNLLDKAKKLNFFKSTSFENLKIKDQYLNNRILLIDEADIFVGYDFLGEIYSPSINIASPQIKALIDMLWKNKDNGLSYNKIVSSVYFKKVIQNHSLLKDIISNQIHGMLYALKNPEDQKTYHVIGNKIYYKQNDGLSCLVHHGYRTIFTYYFQYQRQNIKSMHNLQQMIAINLIIGHFSYTMLPKYFRNILGVTGTLLQISKGQRQILDNYYQVKRKEVIPSIYGVNENRNLKFKTIKPVNLFKNIICQIESQIKQNRPIAIFFKSKTDLYSFCSCQLFKLYLSHTAVVTYQTDYSDRNQRIERATYQKSITLFTSQFSRGTDMKVSSSLADFKGLHVIQTFLPETFCDYVQVIGRTARQGGKGSVTIFIQLSEQQNKQLPQRQVQIKKAQKMIEKAQNQNWQKRQPLLRAKITNANKMHQQTVKLYAQSYKQQQQILNRILNWNQSIFPQKRYINK